MVQGEEADASITVVGQPQMSFKGVAFFQVILRFTAKNEQTFAVNAMAETVGLPFLSSYGKFEGQSRSCESVGLQVAGLTRT